MSVSDYTWIGGMVWWQGFMQVALVLAVIYYQKKPETDPQKLRTSGGLGEQVSSTRTSTWWAWFILAVVSWAALLGFTIEQVNTILDDNTTSTYFGNTNDQHSRVRTAISQFHRPVIGLGIIGWILALQKGASQERKKGLFYSCLVIIILGCCCSLTGATVQGVTLMVASMNIDFAFLVVFLSFFFWELKFVDSYWWHIAACAATTIFVVVGDYFALSDLQSCGFRYDEALCNASNLTVLSVMCQGGFAFLFAPLILWYFVLKKGELEEIWGRTFWLTIVVVSIMSGMLGFCAFALSFQPVGIEEELSRRSRDMFV